MKKIVLFFALICVCICIVSCGKCELDRTDVGGDHGEWVVIENYECGSTLGRFECSSCGYYTSEWVDTENHPSPREDWDDYVPGKEATCTEFGSEAAGVCPHCNYRAYGGDSTFPLGHVLTTVFEKEPTCTEDGYSQHTICSRCNLTDPENTGGGEKEIYPAWGHNYDSVHIGYAYCYECNDFKVDEENGYYFENQILYHYDSEADSYYAIELLDDSVEELVLSGTVNGKSVIYDNGCFSYCQSLKSVTVNGSAIIGERVFEGCSKIEKVVINGAKNIGSSAFSYCSSLKAVDISSVENIGEKVFLGCTSLAEVNMENAVVIGEEAFCYCAALKSLTLPATLATVSTRAFYSCSSLNTLRIEASATIGEGAFQNCSALNTLDIEKVTVIGKYAFAGCTELKNVEIPSTVTTISFHAFEQCTSLKTVIVNGAATIGEYAFNLCEQLETIEMSNVTAIGYMAFRNCNSLESITIPSAVTHITNLFEYCYSLKSVEINGAKTIGKNAFSDCTGLESVIIKGKLTCIDTDAFKNCSSLDYIIFSSVYSGLTIEEGAFSGVGEIDEIYYGSSESDWNSISGTKPEGTVYFYSEYEQTPKHYMYYKTLQWHYGENGEPVFWLNVKNNLSGKTFKMENAEVTVTDWYWNMLLTIKEQGYLEQIADESLRNAIANSETKEDIEMYLSDAASDNYVTAIFATDGTATVYNAQAPDGYTYNYCEIDDSIIFEDPTGAHTLAGDFYTDENGNIYEIQSMDKVDDNVTGTVRYNYVEITD